MSLVKREKFMVELLQESINKNFKGNLDPEYENKIGLMLSYYLKAILEKLHDCNIKEKWIDFVEWKSLHLITQKKIEGVGFLWWGFRKDVSKTFPEDFYCELELDNSRKKPTILYLFRFQMDGKDYELKN